MVKKQIKKSKNNNNEIRESKKENIKEKDNKIKSKKFSIKITSKMKKN